VAVGRDDNVVAGGDVGELLAAPRTRPRVGMDRIPVALVRAGVLAGEDLLELLNLVDGGRSRQVGHAFRVAAALVATSTRARPRRRGRARSPSPAPSPGTTPIGCARRAAPRRSPGTACRTGERPWRCPARTRRSGAGRAARRPRRPARGTRPTPSRARPRPARAATPGPGRPPPHRPPGAGSRRCGR